MLGFSPLSLDPISFAGSSTPTGSANITLDNIVTVISGTVAVAVEGTISTSLAGVSTLISGEVGVPVTGTIGITLEGVSSATPSVGASNEAMIAFFRAATGSTSYQFNELAIAYYKQAGLTSAPAFNESLSAAQQAAGFVGLAPTDWRNL